MYSFLLIALLASLTGCINPFACDDFFIERKYAETQRTIESISKSHKSGELVYSLKDSIRLINKYDFNEVNVIYKGQTVDKTADGFGKAVWIFRKDTLEIFEGEFKDGIYHGKGVQTYTRGEINEGNWINGKMTGVYISRYITGSLVKGVYDGTENNKAEIIHINGDIYSGLVNDNNPNGKGIYTWKTGERFEGLYKFGCKSEGTYYYTDGRKLEIKKDQDIEDFSKSKNLKSEFEFRGTLILADVDIHLLAGKIEYPAMQKRWVLKIK